MGEALVVWLAYFVTIVGQIGYHQIPVSVTVETMKEALECDVGLHESGCTTWE
jgi:hypothetical protein